VKCTACQILKKFDRLPEVEKNEKINQQT
jgi:hypothetical protein